MLAGIDLGGATARVAAASSDGRVHDVGEAPLIGERMRGRSGHYMPASLLDSQFAALEEPTAETDVVRLGIEQSPAVQLDQALAELE